MNNIVKTNFIEGLGNAIQPSMDKINNIISKLNKTNLTSEQEEYLDSLEISHILIKSVINNALEIAQLANEEVVLNKQVFEVDFLINHLVHKIKDVDNKRFTIKNYCDFNSLGEVEGDFDKIADILFAIINGMVQLGYGNSISLNGYIVNGQENNILIKFEISDNTAQTAQILYDTINERSSSLAKSKLLQVSGSDLNLTLSNILLELIGGEVIVEKNDNNLPSIWVMIPVVKQS